LNGLGGPVRSTHRHADAGLAYAAHHHQRGAMLGIVLRLNLSYWEDRSVHGCNFSRTRSPVFHEEGGEAVVDHAEKIHHGLALGGSFSADDLG
jgi:hypothetical protein